MTVQFQSCGLFGLRQLLNDFRYAYLQLRAIVHDHDFEPGPYFWFGQSFGLGARFDSFIVLKFRKWNSFFQNSFFFNSAVTNSDLK